MAIPSQPLAIVAERCLKHLLDLCAIDSQSDERRVKEEPPSSEGQKVIARFIEDKLRNLGLQVEIDKNWNVVGVIESNIEEPQVEPIALMTHLDTSFGTIATRELIEVPNWNGKSLAFPKNPNLKVDVERYPHVAPLVGQTIVHGPGEGPFGLDNKLGGAQVLTLTELLLENPDLKHGKIFIAFRPDEEIGRHAAVESLAKYLAKEGVRIGWTVDGATPFEVNIANFNASKLEVALSVDPLSCPTHPIMKSITLQIGGVDTHGATAHEEGYLNAAVVFTRVYEKLSLSPGIFFVEFERTAGKETTGYLRIVISGDNDQEVVDRRQIAVSAFEREVQPHTARGAFLTILDEQPFFPSQWHFTTGAIRVAEHLSSVLRMALVRPVLSEESSGTQGYTNPHWVKAEPDRMTVRYRVRDFDPRGLKKREDDIRRICALNHSGSVSVEFQYTDMGPDLAPITELIALPKEAFELLKAHTPFPIQQLPVRGGTGVDRFTQEKVYIGNLGPGYFFLESPKELTTRELMGQHVQWLVNLVQVAGRKLPRKDAA